MELSIDVFAAARAALLLAAFAGFTWALMRMRREHAEQMDRVHTSQRELIAQVHALAERSAALATLFREAGICSILLEGGAALHAAAWNARVVDRVRIYVTPDALGPSRVQWHLPPSFDLAALHDAHDERLGRDRLLEGYVHRVD